MKFYVTLSKRQLAVILAVIIIALLVVGQLISAKSSVISGSTNAMRVQYIKSLDLEPDDNNASSKSIVIPEKFSKVYKSYNELQKKAGFDLNRYKGKPATVYTYPLSGTDCELHLIVCNGEIIGGDIAETRVDGEMKPLLRAK